VTEEDLRAALAEESAWAAKLAELDETQFLECLDEMYQRTSIPSLRAVLRAALIRISDAKDLPNNIAIS
jgi:hypothetical protein